MIGNSRFHFAEFQGSSLIKTWDIAHFQRGNDILEIEKYTDKNTPIIVASVVPELLIPWQDYPPAQILSLKDIPLQGTYPTLGIDRALAVWGAGQVLGWPVLVIDGGTALTFTGANQNQTLIGGAILPGIRLQLQSLSQKTAALPAIEINTNAGLPKRWNLNTAGAIESGILYTIVAGIKDFIADWLEQFPESKIVITGGDGELLNYYLKQLAPQLTKNLIFDPFLIFWAMREINLRQFCH